MADYTAELAGALGRSGVRVQVITTAGATPAPNTVPFEVARVTGWGRQAASSVHAHLQAFDPDVVHLQYQTAAFGMSSAIAPLPLALRAQGSRVPFITTFHDLRAPYLFRGAGWFRSLTNHVLLGASRGAVFANPRDLVRAHPRRPAVWIPIGPNVSPRQGLVQARERQRFGLAEDELVIAFFGFVNASKGLEVLLRAVARLVEQRTRVRLLLIGDAVGASDPTNQVTVARVDGLARELGVAGHILRTGRLAGPDVSAWLTAADVAALPFTEGASLNRGSLVACLAHGVPTVTTTPQPVPLLAAQHCIAPFDDLARFRLTEAAAVLVPPGDDAALARALRMLGESRERRATLSAAGRHFVAPLNWNAIARATLGFYAAVGARPTP